MMRIKTEDWVAVSDLLGRYCWAVDEGQADEWASLWTNDGVFSGISDKPIMGTEALRQIPIAEARDFGGRMRHIAGNLNCTYVNSDHDTIRARLYNYVSVWGEHPGQFTLALCEMVLVRLGDDWRIKSNTAKLLFPDPTSERPST